MTTAIKLIDATLHRTETQTRMPFRFGIAVMTAAPHVFLRCRFDIDGTVVTGIAADGLLPKWFDKSPEKEAAQEIDEMLLVIRRAVGFAREVSAASAFEFWQQVYQAQVKWAAEEGFPSLLAQFGVSMVERTLLDALARAEGCSLATLLRENRVGLDLAAIHPELAGHTPDEFLPARPLSKIIARHTVGLSDPLTAADLTPENRIDDGLPQTLEDCIRCYGLYHFKLKAQGDVERDLERLRAVARVITQHCGTRFGFTLDGNEQYREFPRFVELWDRIQADPLLKEFFKQLIFIEQPLYRDVALDPAIANIADWKNGPPVIIDESDATLGALAQALKLGYAGTSHKNCKGIMKAAAHRCLINYRNATEKTSRYQMSGEDLVNIGPVALLQDLAAQAALGNTSVERNGHHYFNGLTPFPQEISQLMLQQHGDLYTTMDDGFARVNITGGELDLTTINAAPFGVGVEIPMDGIQELSL
ncbi:hypothetical protein Pan241w_60440 [Gimesia alba]|uniref:Enolase C-terminal domain-containing protein n=1 Tax=Gimesia alba TaxID=2527973 RepID=A0A517RPV8_9PLAN|nr:enolase C-terminal domain-like protein [Gimesia alba]QDT45916.1 hypothetical protein Pan241w_60440 [Gimesia alba]